MTDKDLKTFRTTLETRLQELSVITYEALAIESSSDEMDRVQFFSERDYAMNNLERNSNRLREVQRALRRMDAGTYGECVSCEEPINVRRLKAVPWAATCITCQEAAEREPEPDLIDSPSTIGVPD